MSDSSMLCRFCAKEQPLQSLLDLKSDEIRRQSITQKLSIFNDVIVDFSCKFLPETVCTSCDSILNTAYTFFVTLIESQVALKRHVQDDHSGVVKEEFDIFKHNSHERDCDPEDTISWLTYQWRCPRCNTMLPDMQAVRDHSQEVHGTCCSFQCADCDIKTEGFVEFVDHVTWHWRDLGKYCEFCNIKMETAAHKESHHNICTRCGQIFENKTLLNAHQRNYIQEPARPQLYIEICNARNNLDNKTDIKNDTSYKIDRETYEIDNKTYESDTINKIDNIFKMDNTNNKTDNTTHKIDSPTQKIDKTTHGIIVKKPKTIVRSGNKKLENRQETKDISNMEKKIDNKGSKTFEEDAFSWSQYPSICRLCNMKFTYKDKLKKHCIKEHGCCFGMKCVDCDNVSLVTFEQFVMHVKEHRPYLINICPHCDSNMLHAPHTQNHTGRHCCTVCGETFRNARALRRHDSKLENPVLKPAKRKGKVEGDGVTCNICGKRMANPLALRAHKITHTDRKRNHTCDRCGKTFYTRGTMEIHQKIHENNNETCKICNKTFPTLQRLRKHVKTHNLVMPFQCDDCKRFYSSKDSLRAHVTVHLNLKPFACQYCLKKFRNKHTMKNHENQHTGARPYSCGVCFANFSCWSNCNKHMTRIHGTPFGKSVMTPHGKIDIDPVTGKPSKFSITSVVKEWGKGILEIPSRKRKFQDRV